MEIIKNKRYVERLYTLLAASIFIHYILVIVTVLLILKEIFTSGEYKKILKNKSLIVVEIILGIAVVTSLLNRNYYGLIAVPILLCLMVARYYTLRIDEGFKKSNLELIGKISVIPFFIGIIEYMVTMDRIGYFSYLNPNYLGSIMMMTAIINLYFGMEKKAVPNFIIFILNMTTILMSGSRSALASAGIGIMILLFYFLERKYFIGCLLLLIGYVLGVYFGRFPFLRLDTIAEYYRLRADIIKTAFKIFKSTDILYGHGNFYYYKLTNYVYPHSHNALTESLISYGVAGTVALGIVVLRYLYDILRNDKKNTLKIALISGVAAHNFTDFTIFWIQTVLLFIMALSYVEDVEERKRIGIRIYRNR